MKQNLLKAICPICKQSFLGLAGWTKKKKEESPKLPDNLLEDKCPECLLEIGKGKEPS